ncbi:hypothetical protein [Streptococcus dysgalactiae]|uniref:hypothetical protein n=1 Tax=Streptococcus dysgalactiae TaxID=1334 RepID=UPI003DA1AB92
MKKKLVMIAAFCLSMCAVSVKAESDFGSANEIGLGFYGSDDYTNQPTLTGDQAKIGFRNDWKDARDFGVKPINLGDSKIEVKTNPGALVRVSLTTGETTNSIWELTSVSSSMSNGIYTNTYKIKPTIANSSGIATFDLANSGKYDKEKSEIIKSTESNAKKGDTYSVTTSIDGWTIGSGKWTVGESKARDIEEREAKEKADREKKEQEAKAKEEEEQKEQEVQDTQAEVISSESKDQTNESRTETQSDTEGNGVEEHSTATQNNESAQQSDNTGHKEESFWAKRFTSSIRSVWNKVKSWFTGWWQG